TDWVWRSNQIRVPSASRPGWGKGFGKFWYSCVAGGRVRLVTTNGARLVTVSATPRGDRAITRQRYGWLYGNGSGTVTTAGAAVSTSCTTRPSCAETAWATS